MKIADFEKENYGNDLIEMFKFINVIVEYQSLEVPESVKKHYIAQITLYLPQTIKLVDDVLNTKTQEEKDANPLIMGMINVLKMLNEKRKTGHLKEEDILKAFEDYQKIRQAVPFKGNEKMYMDAGCEVSAEIYDPQREEFVENGISFLAPLHLLKSFDGMEGDNSFVHPANWGRYVNLTPQQLEVVHKKAPEAFDEKTEKLYQKTTAQEMAD